MLNDQVTAPVLRIRKKLKGKPNFPNNNLTSTIKRLMSPNEIGIIQVESGKVRSGNQSTPPTDRF